VIDQNYIYDISTDWRTDKPELNRRTVAKVTPKRVFTSRDDQNIARQFDADRVHWTAEAAWDAHIANLQRLQREAREEVDRCDAALAKARAVRDGVAA
jgi:hypothetical protein